MKNGTISQAIAAALACVATDCALATSPVDPGGSPATGSSSADASAPDDGGSGSVAWNGPAPRAIAPLSTATVTSLRPTLRWVLAPGMDGARVELCRDRACTVPVATMDAAGTSVAPAEDLPSGVYFWRLRGRTGAVVSDAASPTWEFFVRARGASTDTSWGTVPDVDGDGLADVLVGAVRYDGQPGVVYVFRGTRDGPANATRTRLDGLDAALRFGASVASAGDVNGDGYADVIVGAADPLGYGGRAHLYLGGPDGISTAAATSLETVQTGEAYAHAVSSAGDVNGDGYADVLIGAPGQQGAPARVYLYLGSANGLSTRYALALKAEYPTIDVGFSVASAGDVNADGYGDVVVGGPSVTGRAFVFLGGARGLAEMPAVSLEEAAPGSLFGEVVDCAGDVNGDGYADVVVSAPYEGNYTGAVRVYLGGDRGTSPTPAAVLVGDAYDQTGAPAKGAGDVNGDGFDDLVVGAPNAGVVRWFPGGAAGLSTSPAATISLPSGPHEDRIALSGVGDVNGDGLADVVVSAPEANERIRSAQVYLGAIERALSGAPAATLLGASAELEEFGASIASNWNVPRRVRPPAGRALTCGPNRRHPRTAPAR